MSFLISDLISYEQPSFVVKARFIKEFCLLLLFSLTTSAFPIQQMTSLTRVPIKLNLVWASNVD